MSMKLTKIVAWIDKQLSRLTGLFALVGSIGVFGLMIIIIIGVFWRYVLGNPIFGIDDLSKLILSIVAAAAVIYGARNNAHVSVNVIDIFCGRRVTRITDAIMRTLAVVILAAASYALSSKACGMAEACITENLSVEHEPFYYILSAAIALYSLHILTQLIVGLLHFNTQDPNDLGE
jgi:TRAP-type C4-dicarboxylate transport system permease small subunit